MQPLSGWNSGTISDALDRLDSLIGRIGMNSREQALEILAGMDVVALRIQQVDSPASHKTLQVQFDALLSRLKTEASSFLRDVGGRQALIQLRTARRPPAENIWWFLDEWLTQRRQSSMKRSMLSLGALVLGLVLLAVVYQVFFAPDPAVVARITHEENARDAMGIGDLDKALSEIDQGLTYDPQNLDLLTLRGVTLEAAGRLDEAHQAYEAAASAADSRVDFLLVRGQAYAGAGMLDAALADTQAVIAENPQSALGHLLAGQVYEIMQDYLQALENYETAANLADAQDQPELTAMARARMAFLTQILNAPRWPTDTTAP